MKQVTKLKQFDKITIQKIIDRDQGCIFCKNYLFMPPTSRYEQSIHDIMHIVNKSQGGLGIEQNGVLGCRYHHSQLDNGNQGLREQMQEFIESYMKEQYENWDRKDLVFDKWK